MEFFTFGPLATTIYFILCWLELVIILWLLYIQKSNTQLDSTIKEFTEVLKKSFVLNLKKEDIDDFLKNYDDSHTENEKRMLEKIDELLVKLIKHDKRFFMRTKELKNVFSCLLLSRKTKNAIFNERKIDYYENDELTEDIDTDEDGYKDL